MTTEEKQQLREEILEKFTRRLDPRLDLEVHAIPGELVDFIIEKIEEAERVAAICPKCFDSLERYKELHMGTIVGYKYECIGCGQIYTLIIDN